MHLSSDLAAHTDTAHTSSSATGNVVQRVGDGLFEIRCLAEDLKTALDDGMDTATIADIATELIMKTREVERFIP